jgi:hypothetical protein
LAFHNAISTVNTSHRMKWEGDNESLVERDLEECNRVIFRDTIILKSGELSPQGLKRTGYEADHSPPSSADIKNDSVIPPLPLTSPGNSA